MDQSAHIMHRVHGTTVDVAGSREVAKKKVTITQRFVLDGCEGVSAGSVRGYSSLGQQLSFQG